MGEFDRASFKDPEGRVFERDGRIYRTLSEAARARMQTLFDDGILPPLIEEGLVIPSRLIPARQAALDPTIYGAVVMEHARIPVITYPYEWSFDMLRAAALLTLDLLMRCLDHDLILKDATAFNVALVKGRMRLIDVLSIDHYQDGQPWDGYSQFCREFLFPLMLTAYKGVAFQPWLRSSLTGIQAGDLARLFGPRDLFRPGVFKHVVMQAKLERSFADQDLELRRSFMQAKIGKNMIRANLARLASIILGMRPRQQDSAWIGYTADSPYSDAEEEMKRAFVAHALDEAGSRRVIDLGANTGAYSVVAAAQADLVISADMDPACVDVLFRRVGNQPDGAKLVPMVLDLTNPSPSQGWALAERKDLFERLQTDAFLALALVHHICIGGNVPLDQFVALLARMGRAGVVEWIDKEDEMVQRLLRNRVDIFSDYSWSAFTTALDRHFEIQYTRESHGGRRRLCFVTAR